MIAAFDEPIRPHSRRQTGRRYATEHLSNHIDRQRHRESPSELVASLAAAGAVGSTLRSELKRYGIDPKLARLVLLFYGRRPLRVGDVAWRLNISAATASRHLDRAERSGLVDKFYDPMDRRGTWARLTEHGRTLRVEVERLLTAHPSFERPLGEYPARGWRAMRWDDP